MANPLSGLQQRSAADTLEYLGWAAAQLVRFGDIREHAHTAVTAQALVDAGVQVWRHYTGTGHSYVYWPGKMSSPVQCFNPRAAASAVMKQAGWKEALGLDKLPAPPPEEPADAAAAAADADATAAEPAADAVAAAGSVAAAVHSAAAGVAVAPAATPAAADASAADSPASGAAAAGSEQQKPQEGAGTAISPAEADAAVAIADAAFGPSSGAAAAKSEGDAMDVDAAGDTGDEVDAAAAAGIDNTGCFPGYTFLRPEKEQQVLVGVADKLTVLARRNFTGAEIRGLGLRAVAETKRQRRQYSIWWPGKMADTEEPVHCAPSYTVGAMKLLAHPACREALGVTSLPPPVTAGPISSSELAALAGPLSGSKRPAGDTSATADAHAKRTRAAADASEAAAAAVALAAVAAEDDVKQPLAALAAAAGLALAPGRSASAIAAAAAAAKKHHGPVPGSEVLQAVKQYTGNTKEVQVKVKAALQQLADALKVAAEAKTWSPESIKALPGGAVLAAGLDTHNLTNFISEAQEMRDSLAADAAQLDTLLAQSASGSRAAAGSSSGGGGRTRGSGSAAAEAAYRKPIVAFRSALEACAADVIAWLRQRQQDVLQRLQAVKEVKSLVESNRELKQQLAQVKRQLQEQQQQRRGSSVDDGDRGRPGDARRAAEERRQQQQQEQQRQQLLVLLEQQKQQKQQQLAMRRQQQRQRDPKQQREQEEEEAEDEALLLAPQQQMRLQPLQLHHADVPSAGKGHAKPAQVRAAAEALMAAARAKAAAVQEALLGTGAGNDRAQNGAGAGKAAAAEDEEEDDIAASSKPTATMPAAAPADVPAVAAEQQQEEVPAFPQNAPGSVLQFLQHLMKTGSSRPAANGAAAAGQEADDMDDDF